MLTASHRRKVLQAVVFLDAVEVMHNVAFWQRAMSRFPNETVLGGVGCTTTVASLRSNEGVTIGMGATIPPVGISTAHIPLHTNLVLAGATAVCPGRDVSSAIWTDAASVPVFILTQIFLPMSAVASNTPQGITTLCLKPLIAVPTNQSSNHVSILSCVYAQLVGTVASLIISKSQWPALRSP